MKVNRDQPNKRLKLIELVREISVGSLKHKYTSSLLPNMYVELIMF